MFILFLLAVILISSHITDEYYKLIAFCTWCICVMIYGIVHIIIRKDKKDEPFISIQKEFRNRK
nr:MAG TPA: hypothetical protein [Bacteriophage sp.]